VPLRFLLSIDHHLSANIAAMGWQIFLSAYFGAVPMDWLKHGMESPILARVPSQSSNDRHHTLKLRRHSLRKDNIKPFWFHNGLH